MYLASKDVQAAAALWYSEKKKEQNKIFEYYDEKYTVEHAQWLTETIQAAHVILKRVVSQLQLLQAVPATERGDDDGGAVRRLLVERFGGWAERIQDAPVALFEPDSVKCAQRTNIHLHRHMVLHIWQKYVWHFM